MLTFILTSFVSVLCISLAFYCGVFSLWRRYEHEHIDEIDRLFDKVFISTALGYIAAKIGAYLLAWPLEQFSLVGVLFGAESVYPLSIAVGLLTLFALTKRDWRDAIHLVDLASISLSLFFALLSLVRVAASGFDLLLGQYSMSVLIVFIIQIVGSVVYFAIAKILARLELTYRTFTWYRYRRSSAQSGFIVALFCILSGAWEAIRAVVIKGPSSIGGAATLILSLLLILSGFVILLIRSGRTKSKQR